MKRKLMVVLLTIAMAFALSSCAEKKQDELTVFAAASMTESLQELKDVFEKENTGVKLVYNFDSSGTLNTQIEEGATCDVFISAAKKQMDELDPKSDTYKSKASIDSNSRFNLLENEVTLAVKKDSDKNINSFLELVKKDVKTVAIGNSDVPVGQYSKELLTKLEIWDKIQDKISFASNVKEVTSWISEGAADCGIIYSTDAKAAGLKIVDTADSSQFKNRIIYPAAIVEKTKNKDSSQKFLELLKSDKAIKVFEKYGFKKAK